MRLIGPTKLLLKFLRLYQRIFMDVSPTDDRLVVAI
jgi:hypothetical protein